MKLNSIQFCWWQSRWDFPTFFRLTLKTSRCPFYYSSKWSWLEICLGSANSNPVPSKAGLKALQHIFSEHISQSQVLPEVDRSHLQPPCLPSLPHAPPPPSSSGAEVLAASEEPACWQCHHASSNWKKICTRCSDSSAITGTKKDHETLTDLPSRTHSAPVPCLPPAHMLCHQDFTNGALDCSW